MKQKDLTEADITNYIFTKSREGKKYIVWTNPRAIEAFRNVGMVLCAPDEYGMGWKFPDNFPHKQTFMGIKHYVGGKYKELFNENQTKE